MSRNTTYIILIVVGLGAVVWFFYTPSTQETPTLSQELIPLPNELSWSAPQVENAFEQGSSTLSGLIITSEVLDESFNLRSYYDDQLVQDGWIEDLSIAAGGPTGSRWGYEKDGLFIIFTENRELLDVASGKPSQCPCEYTYEVFWSQK